MTDNTIRSYRACVDGQTITVTTRGQRVIARDFGNERGWHVEFRWSKSGVPIVKTPRGQATMVELLDPSDGPGF